MKENIIEENQIVLTMNHICKSFYDNQVLQDVGIALKKGEILAILGENGAGKSTLMKILSGIYPAGSYSGTIAICGKEKTFRSPRDAQNAGIAMIYQEINLELDLTVAENIFVGHLPRTSRGLVDWKRMKRESETVLKTLGIDLDVGMMVRNLSASIQQLICIARSLILNPLVLVLDEPTAALTESETKFLVDILHKLQEKGISCIYISHKLEEVFHISDRVVVLRDGTFISEYTGPDYPEEQIVEDIIGRKMENMYPYVPKTIGEEVLRVEDFTVPHPYNKKVNIVDHVSFTVRAGEVLGLAGLVGAGRSEILRAIYGVMRKKAGTVYLDNKAVSVPHGKTASVHGISLLGEDRKRDGYVKSMNVRQNLTLSYLDHLRKGPFIDRKREFQLAQEYFKMLGVKASSLETSILSLSGGNQQKVLLGKCIITNPRVLLLDEPTRGVDIGAKSEIYGIIAELAAKGMSIVIVSSELPELYALCDRFVVLASGSVSGELKKAEASQVKIMNLSWRKKQDDSERTNQKSNPS